MKTLTQNEILEELMKLGISSEEDLQISYKEYTLYLNNENLFSGETI
ncbi:MAG: hypothetical protein HZC48_13525 [Nitrospirae bacterium]|nr:hypothetical protein [Nitrospirota bacterium]